ncbi:LamG-like jellyroll fold domain-containing protein [Nocardioides lentus]|uniref:LamG-like jellyroll fold domain-containing protein n=1 Tax=Nocardioides lentus TaxID=338077 RepID=UPI0031D192D8
MVGGALRRGAAVGLAAGLVLAAAQGHAFWTATTTAGSAGEASALRMPAGPVPDVEVSDRDDVRVTWAGVGLADGTPADAYVVTRVADDGTTYAATGGCAGPVPAGATTTTCREDGVPDGVWTYRVAPRLASWSGPVGAASAAVRTDATAPSTTVGVRGEVGGSALTGSTVWFRGAAAGSFRVVTTVADPGGSGPARATTSAVGAPGWTHAGGPVTTPPGGPYLSAPVAWAAGTTAGHDLTVTGADVAGNTRALTLAVRRDDDAPTGGEVGLPDGATTATTTAVRVDAAQDGGSGVAGRRLEGTSAPLAGNACGDFGPWTLLSVDPGPTYDWATPAGRCFRARHVVVDRVGNAREAVAPQTVKVRDYAATITATPGLVSYWRLGERAGSTLTAVRGSAGSYGGGPGLGGAGAIVGDPDTAASFDGVDDHASVARPVSGSFSLELWFRSVQGRGSSGSWTNGAALLDASTPTFLGESGFGISVFADGRVVAGVADGLFAPARTAVSSGGHLDGRWHHVVMTRDARSGRVELYVDGELRAVAAGWTGALSRAARMGLGRLQGGGNAFQGDLDEVAAYDRVLDAGTVRDHYLSGLP